SWSPILLQLGRSSIRSGDEELREGALRSIHETTHSFAKTVYDETEKFSAVRPFATTAARVATSFQNVVRRAACLTQDDFTEARGFLGIDSGKPGVDRLLNGPIPDLLATNPKFITHFASTRSLQDNDSPPGRLERWRLQGPEYVGYRLFLLAWRYLPKFLARGHIQVLGGNEILRETAFHLGLRGYAISECSLGNPKPASLDAGQITALEEIAHAGLSHFDKQLCARALSRCESLLKNALASGLADHAGAFDAYRAGTMKNRTAVLANSPGTAQAAAYAQVCRQNDAPFTSFQHGVGREIAKNHNEGQAGYEPAVSDVCFTYSDAGARASADSPYAAGCRCVAVGISRQHRRVAGTRRSKKPKELPCLYVSTTVYRNNHNRLSGWMTDQQAASWEMNLVENVLAKLRRRTIFKSYVAPPRYLGIDPVIDMVKRTPSVELYDRQIDLRYLLRKPAIVIVARATSTLAWCLLSGNPMVYIDIPSQTSLNDEARSAFEKSVFFFDSGTSYVERLVEFLARPNDAILEAWEGKAAAREELIRSFFAGPPGSAGRRAANVVEDMLQ
ncbi:MAG: hypothetical protein HOI95_21895, partial [Chromatiales bacterium]|nr:hypothetical protein [Chromatiales bacterium]